MKKDRLAHLILSSAIFLCACATNDGVVPGCYDLLILRPRFAGQITEVTAMTNGSRPKAVGACADTACVWTIDEFGVQIANLPMVPGCSRSIATDITDNGKICGYGIVAGTQQIIPVRWEDNQVIVPSLVNKPADMTKLAVYSIGDNGQTTGTSRSPRGDVIYIIQPDGQMVFPRLFGGDTSSYLSDLEKRAYGACGNFSIPGLGQRAFYADQSSLYVVLNAINGSRTIATRLSGNRISRKVFVNGSAEAYSASAGANSIYHAVIWEVAYGGPSFTVNTVDCGTLPGADEATSNACNSGRVAVGTSGGFAFAWSVSTGMIKLNNLVHPPPGLTMLNLYDAVDINEEGRVCGNMTSSMGKLAYLLMPGNCSSISMTKTAPENVRRNGILEYSFLINNNTANNNASVTVTDRVPANATFDPTIQQSENWILNGDSVSVTRNVAPGSSYTLRLLLRANGSAGSFITNDHYSYTVNGTDYQPVNIARVTRITESTGLVFDDTRQCFTVDTGTRVNYTADETLLTGTAFDRIEFFEGLTRVGSVSAPPYTVQGSVLHKGFMPVRAVAMRGNTVVKTYRPLCMVVGDMDTPSPVYEIVELPGIAGASADMNDSNLVCGTYYDATNGLKAAIWRNGVPTFIMSGNYLFQSINNSKAMYFSNFNSFVYRFPDGTQTTIGDSTYYNGTYQRKISNEGKILLSQWLPPPAIPTHRVWNGAQFFKLLLPQGNQFVAPNRMTDNGFVIGIRYPAATPSQGGVLCYGNTNQPNANGEIAMTDIAGAPEFSSQMSLSINNFGTIVDNQNRIFYVNPAIPSQLIGTLSATVTVDNAGTIGRIVVANDADMFSGSYVFQEQAPDRKAFLWICGKAYKLENLVAPNSQLVFNYAARISIDGSILCGVLNENHLFRYVLLKPIR